MVICGSSASDWADEEFGGAELGDERRTRRLVKIAAGIAEKPERCISASCGKSGAQAVSRLFNQKETTMETVLAPHIEQTRLRCREKGGWVLAVQDTTTLDFGGREGVRGLGPIGQNQKSQGLLMHNLLALTPEKRPLGLLGIQLWARPPGKKSKKSLISERESAKWLVGLRQAEQAVDEDQSLLLVGDRESDIYPLFVEPRRKNTHLLVRVAYDRALAEGEHRCLFKALDESPVAGRYQIEVPRQGKRPKRTATLEVRIAALMLKPPANRARDVANLPVKVYLVRTREIDPPEDVEALEWILLTTKPTQEFEEAKWLIEAYAVRWVIEEFHRVLKSECKAEDMQFETADRLKPAIALCAVVAWRILALTKSARDEPEAAASTIASEKEIAVVEAWLKSQGEENTEVKTVSQFVRGVGMLGGFLGRKSDGMPGPKTVGRGLTRLQDLLTGLALANYWRSDKG